MDRKPFLSEDGFWKATITWQGKTMTSSLRTRDSKLAHAKQADINALMSKIDLGLVTLPEGVSIREFVFEGKKESQQAIDQKTKGLRTFLAEFISGRKPPAVAQNTFVTEGVHVNHLRRFLDAERIVELPIAQVRPQLFDKYKAARMAEVGTNTINKELATFRLIFAQALAYGLVGTNPLDAVKRYKKAGAPQRFRTAAEIRAELAARDYSEEEQKELWECRFLTGAEIGQLLELAREKDPALRPLLVFAAFTGARRSEIARLQWSDVELWDIGPGRTEGGKVWLTSPKGSRTEKNTSRDVGMHPDLRSAICAQKLAAGRAPRVFPDFSLDEMSRRLKALVDGTDFEGIGWHTLRHSFASNLAAQGVDQRIIDGLMGHQTKEMQERYRHLFPEKKDDAVRALSFQVGAR